MRKFIELTEKKMTRDYDSRTGYYSYTKIILAIDQIVCVKDDKIYTLFSNNPIWCKESYQEIKEKIRLVLDC